MSALLIIMLLSFCAFYIATRTVYLKITKKTSIIIELHLPITAISFSVPQKRNIDFSHKYQSRIKIPISSYPKIIRNVSKLIDNAKIKISDLSFPISSDLKEIYKYNALGFTALAFLKDRSKNLTVDDNVIPLFYDTSTFQVDITLNIFLYQLVNFIFAVVYSITKEKCKKRINQCLKTK